MGSKLKSKTNLKGKTVFSIMIIVFIIFIFVLVATALNKQMQPLVGEYQIKVNNYISSKILPLGDGFTTYTRDTVVGINECYIANNGEGIVTKSDVISNGSKIEIYVGVNSQGLITGVYITGDDYEGTLLEKRITEEYLLGYIGKSDFEEDTLKEYGEIEVKSSAEEVSESIYQTVKLALKQYSEIYKQETTEDADVDESDSQEDNGESSDEESGEIDE